MPTDNAPNSSYAETRIISALESIPHRVPCLVGPCGSGRTSILMRIVNRLGQANCQYIDAERTTSTPELFYSAILSTSPYSSPNDLRFKPSDRSTPRDTFERLLRFFTETKSSNKNRPTFVIDEILELRTFENFPGLRDSFQRFLDAVLSSPNHFVFSSRYAHRVRHLLRELPDNFELIQHSGLSPSEVIEQLKEQNVRTDSPELREIGQILHSLTDGRPSYLEPLIRQLHIAKSFPDWNILKLLSSQLRPGSTIYSNCRFSYELRLHRSRGHGSLKAILAILAAEEPLTLTEVALRIGRTPGSTRDYLLWLEDVDLVSVHQKQYCFADPIMRLWVRLHMRPVPPSETDLKKEVRHYAVSRMPHLPSHLFDNDIPAQSIRPFSEQSPAKKSWELVEID